VPVADAVVAAGDREVFGAARDVAGAGDVVCIEPRLQTQLMQPEDGLVVRVTTAPGLQTQGETAGQVEVNLLSVGREATVVLLAAIVTMLSREESAVGIAVTLVSSMMSSMTSEQRQKMQLFSSR